MSEVDIEKEIAAMAEEVSSLNDIERERKFKAAKEVIESKTSHLKKLITEKTDLEALLKKYNKEIQEETNNIRKLWMPFIQGVTECDLSLDNGLVLKMKEKINISVEDKDQAIQWFQDNGYEGVMKWDIHHQTMSAIAREKFGDLENPIEIPGLKYSVFPVIKVKA